MARGQGDITKLTPHFWGVIFLVKKVKEIY